MKVGNLEESAELSEDVKAKLDAACEHHPTVRQVFYEAHKDWDSAIMQLRLIFEPLLATGRLYQTASFIDDGSGSTAKGTVRELVDSCLGPYNGDRQLGYTCTLNVETLASKKCEGPSGRRRTCSCVRTPSLTTSHLGSR